jgi:hypothetical protein
MNKKGWTGYGELNNTVSPKTEFQFSNYTAEELFNSKSTKKIKFTDHLFRTLLKLNFEYGLSFNPASINNNNYNFTLILEADCNHFLS